MDTLSGAHGAQPALAQPPMAETDHAYASSVDIISRLPVEILQLQIFPYFNARDFAALSRVSTAYRRNFRPWRGPLSLRRHISDQLVEDAEFRATVLRSLEPLNLRIHVNLSRADCRGSSKWPSNSFVDDASSWRGVHSLDLSGSSVRDVSALGGVHSLNLSRTGVADVSMLGSVHTLNLSGTYVTDVSALGGVHTLNLSHTRVTDVSMLGRVHTVDISRTCVVDVSALGGVHSLDLSGTAVTDVSALGGVHALNLSETPVTDFSMLGGVHTLNLSSTAVADVTSLGTLHTLTLCKTRVTDVSALGVVHALYMSGTGVTDVSALGGVHTLDLSDTPVTDVSALGGVHALCISGTRVTDVSALSGVHILDLSDTPVTDVSALGDVHTLHVSYSSVSDVSSLGRVHTLTLSGCDGLTDVSALGGVCCLTLNLIETPKHFQLVLGVPRVRLSIQPTGDYFWEYLPGLCDALEGCTLASALVIIQTLVETCKSDKAWGDYMADAFEAGRLVRLLLAVVDTHMPHRRLCEGAFATLMHAVSKTFWGDRNIEVPCGAIGIVIAVMQMHSTNPRMQLDGCKLVDTLLCRTRNPYAVDSAICPDSRDTEMEDAFGVVMAAAERIGSFPSVDRVNDYCKFARNLSGDITVFYVLDAFARNATSAVTALAMVDGGIMGKLLALGGALSNMFFAIGPAFDAFARHPVCRARMVANGNAQSVLDFIVSNRWESEPLLYLTIRGVKDATSRESERARLLEVLAALSVRGYCEDIKSTLTVFKIVCHAVRTHLRDGAVIRAAIHCLEELATWEWESYFPSSHSMRLGIIDVCMSALSLVDITQDDPSSNDCRAAATDASCGETGCDNCTISHITAIAVRFLCALGVGHRMEFHFMAATKVMGRLPACWDGDYRVATSSCSDGSCVRKCLAEWHALLQADLITFSCTSFFGWMIPVVLELSEEIAAIVDRHTDEATRKEAGAFLTYLDKILGGGEGAGGLRVTTRRAIAFIARDLRMRTDLFTMLSDDVDEGWRPIWADYKRTFYAMGGATMVLTDVSLQRADNKPFSRVFLGFIGEVIRGTCIDALDAPLVRVAADWTAGLLECFSDDDEGTIDGGEEEYLSNDSDST
eukprot:Opistho-2@34567